MLGYVAYYKLLGAILVIQTIASTAAVVPSAAPWDRLSESLMKKLKESLNDVDARFTSFLLYVLHERLRRMQSRYVWTDL